MQLSFIDTEQKPEPEVLGLKYIPDFITLEKSLDLVKKIDSQAWLNDLKRRVQHYGWKYDYTARRITADLKIGDLPDWLQELAEDLYSRKIFTKIPDQIIINEYLAGQGISAHTDCISCFCNIVASLSLGSACIMDFINPETSEKSSILLEPLSLLVMNDDARYKWQHSIAARKTDRINGLTINRQRRISLTFRNVIMA